MKNKTKVIEVPLSMQGGRIVASETRILTSATSSPFIRRSALKDEGGLWSCEDANAALGYTGFALQGVDESGGLSLRARSSTLLSNCTVENHSEEGG